MAVDCLFSGNRRHVVLRSDTSERLLQQTTQSPTPIQSSKKSLTESSHVTSPEQFSQSTQLSNRPPSLQVNLCILFSQQSTDSQSRLAPQQSTQPALEFFGIFWCGLSSAVYLTAVSAVVSDQLMYV